MAMNILFVGAHHDDLEVSAGGSVHRWTAEGHRVYSATLTNSTWTGPDGTRFRDPADVERCASNAAELLGYTQINLNYCECFELRYTDDKVTTLLGLMDQHEIDTLITISPNDAHPDHRAASEIALNAARKIPRIFFTRVSWNSYPRGFKPNYFVDISDHLEAKREALKCYRDEYQRTGEQWEKFVQSSATLYGLEAGYPLAEGFEVLKYCYGGNNKGKRGIAV